jgi:CHASE3 domain sensor protein
VTVEEYETDSGESLMTRRTTTTKQSGKRARRSERENRGTAAVEAVKEKATETHTENSCKEAETATDQESRTKAWQWWLIVGGIVLIAAAVTMVKKRLTSNN